MFPFRASAGTRLLCSVTAVLAAVLAAVLPARAPAQGAPVAVGVKGRSNQSVTVAAQGQFVALAFAATEGTTTDVFVAVSMDGGARFAEPVRVNATPGDARVGGEQPPRVALVPHKGARADIAVVWTAKSDEGTRLKTARSVDGGKTFGPTTVVPGSDGAGNRGWESIAVDPNGRLLTLWLDHRETVKPKSDAPAGQVHDMAEMNHDPTAKAQLSKLYFSALDERAPHVIAAGVCYCCKTSLVAGADGSVYGVWRHVYSGSQRDIALTVSRDGGRTFASPVRVSEDHWEFDGCPENGPALAVSADGHVHVAWPTPPDGKTGTPLALFYAMSVVGRTFAPRVRVPTKGPANHAQLTVGANGTLVLAWDELGTGGRTVKVARGQPAADGKVKFDELRLSDAGSAMYPSVAATTGGVVVAWTRIDGSTSTIAVARVANR